MSDPSESPDAAATPEGRLAAAWDRHVGADRQLLDAVISRHRERHRRYHTLSHVDVVVARVIELARVEDVTDHGALVAAAAYHDAVYEPRSPANERASARLARRDLASAGWETERLDRVEAMIIGTASHLDPTDADAAVLFDADLAVLASSDYDRYVEAVRDEYRHVGDDEWRSGRADVLRGFLDRARIYATSAGFDRWESAARVNITDELASLTIGD